jgi:hypothetical protein
VESTIIGVAKPDDRNRHKSQGSTGGQMTDLSMEELNELYNDRDHTRIDPGVFRRVVKQAMEVEKLREALEQIATTTYGTELCNSDDENNEILAKHHFINQGIARDALKGKTLKV